MRKRRQMFVWAVVLLAMIPLALYAGGQSGAASGSGAENVNLSGFPIVKEQINLRATAVQGPTGKPLNEMPLYQQLEELTNIKVEFQMIPSSAETEKINLLLASQDYPDFFYHQIPNLGLPQSLGDRNVVISLDEYLNPYAPNFSAMLARFPDVKSFITNPDGKIYSFPLYRNMFDINSCGWRPYINLAWLEKLTLDMPETPEDFYKVLKAFKTQDPNGNGIADEIPLSLIAGANGDVSGWIGMFGAWEVVYTYMMKNGKVTLGHMQPGFKEGLKHFNRLYEEGLLDPESFTQGNAQLRAKLTVNDTFMIGAFRNYVSWVVMDKKYALYYKDFYDPTPNDELTYDIITPLKGPSGSQLWPQVAAVVNLSPAATMISTKNANVEATVRWIDTWMDGTDWGYSAEEGQKDIDWSINSEGFAAAHPPPEGVTRNDRRAQICYSSAAHFWDNDVMPQVIQYGWLTQAEMVDKLRPYYDLENRYPIDYFPLPEEEEIIKRYWPGILLYINENMTRFITGDLDIESNWENYLNGFKALGLDEVLAALQPRYDRFIQASAK